MQDSAVSDEMTGTMWRDPNWLSAFPLDERSALDYFSMSPFYDRNCNNEELRRRGEGPERLAALPPGLEYHLQDAQPPHLFVIRKLQRHPGNKEDNIAFYYILDGSIYQAPTLHTALFAKMRKCLHNVKAGFVRMQQDLDPLQKAGLDGSSSTAETAKVAAMLQKPQEPLSRAHVTNVDNIILTVLQKDERQRQQGAKSTPSNTQSSAIQQGDRSMSGASGRA